MMNDNQQLLVDPDFAIELVKNQSYLSTTTLAVKLIEAWGEQFDEPLFNKYVSYAFLFEIGRMQGIREERARRRKSPQQ